MEVSGLLHTLATSPRVKSPGTYCVGSQVDPRASLDLFGEEKISSTVGMRTADRRTCSLTAVPTILSWFSSFFISQIYMGEIFKLA